MPRPPAPVSVRVNRLLIPALTLALSASAFAVDVDPRMDKAVRAALPVCGDAKVKYEASPVKMPPGFKSVLVQIESARPACSGQMIAVMTGTGGFFLGSPWPIADEPGTIEEKLAGFTLRNLREAMTVTVDRKAPTEDGLLPVTVWQATEAGKLGLTGFADPRGQIFFLGNFHRLNADVVSQRTKAFDTFVANAPVKGAAGSAVTIMEFSDFQCPSCRRSSGYADSIIARHGANVRYVRYDLPLAGHPWAFPAALAGRAIFRQNPALFWQYKKDVYDSQDQLTAFTFWDWARAWAEDHELDLKRYDTDLANDAIKAEILRGAAAAFSNDIRATPTYMVNGTIVDYGDDGKALAEYVDRLLTK